MTHSPAFDASIPVLTEVVDEARPAAPDKVDDPATLEERAMSGWDDAQWELLERRLCERILHQLNGRIDFVLESRVQDALGEVLQRALKGLTADIRDGLQQTLEKIVARAVTQEIAHLQAQKK